MRDTLSIKRILLASVAASLLVALPSVTSQASASSSVVDISKQARDGSPRILVDRASSGEVGLYFLYRLKLDIAYDPGNKDAIIARAKEARPDLQERIDELAALDAEEIAEEVNIASPNPTPKQPTDGTSLEKGSGSGSPSALAIGGVIAGGAAAAALAMGGGGSGGGSDDGNGGGWKNPDPLPPPEYGDDPSDFETPEYSRNSSLGQINASSAYARKLSGEGVVLAVMDTGIDLGHSEFKDRIVDPYNAYYENDDVKDRDGHGTHVAGIMAGAKDGKGMHGVAWSSQILPISFADKNGDLWDRNGGETTAFGWRHAASKGAKAINNSWSYGGQYIDNRTKEQLEASIPNLISAARDMVANDVITVFTTGNDEREEPSVLAGLPHFFPELKSHWVAVGAINRYGHLSDYSSHCGSAAEWCMVAPGDDIYAPVPGGYTQMSGTSMAAPHVTGAIGVLYQAFPYLEAEEIVQILFESADDIGPAEIYGHGLLNLERATRPLGETRIPMGSDVAGAAESLSGSSIRVSAAFGDGIGQALADKTVMALDAYDRGYEISLANFASRNQDTRKDALHRLKLFGGLEERSINTISNGPFSITTATRLRSNDAGLGHSPYSRMSFGFSGQNVSAEASVNPDVGRDFGFREMGFAQAPMMDARSFDQPHLALMETGFGSTFGFGVGDHSELRMGAFSGSVEIEDQSVFANSPSMFGAIGEMTSNLAEGITVKAAVGAISEEGSLLGSVSRGAFGEDMRSNTLFANVGGTFEVASDTSVTLAGSLGHSSFRQNGGLIRSGDDIVTSAFGVGLSRTNLAQDGDVFTLAVAQPLRVESGQVNLSVPTSRNMDGSIGYSTLSLSPKPSGREVNLQASYGFDIMEGVETSIGGMHRFDANHVRGKQETIGMVSFSFKF